MRGQKQRTREIDIHRGLLSPSKRDWCLEGVISDDGIEDLGPDRSGSRVLEGSGPGSGVITKTSISTKSGPGAPGAPWVWRTSGERLANLQRIP